MSTEQQIKHHWRTLVNPDYIGAYTLLEGGTTRDLIVTIQSVARRMVKGADGKEDECTVAQLAGQKPFIINATNSKMLTKLFGSPYIEDWTGKPFTLYVAKVKVAGDTVDSLRIRPQLPVMTLPELTPQHEKWEGARKALKDKNTTLDAIKKSYSITPENEKLLTA